LGFFHIIQPAWAQSILDVELQYFKDRSGKEVTFPPENHKVDSAQLQAFVNKKLFNLYESGFLAAESRILHEKGKKTQLHFFTNDIFEIVRLASGNVDEEILSKVGYDRRVFVNKPFSHQRIVKLLNSILDYAENHGYPFASVKLDSIEIKDSKISTKLNYRSGPLIVFDSLLVSGYDKVKSKYLMTHLGIYQGEPYEERLVREIVNKMKLLPFVSLASDPVTNIFDGKCNILLTLSQNKVSKLDGILGILPNEREGSNVLITGQLNLDLHNLLATGKRLAIEWQSYNANSQLLDASYLHPNLFRTPLHIQGEFYLLKQDTTFINRQFSLDLSILSKNSHRIGFRTEFIASRLIGSYEDSGIVELPENNDYNLNYYGLNYVINRFDHLYLPTRGWAFDFNGSVGQKKIIRNPTLDDVVYQNVDLNSIQLRVSSSIEKFWRIYKNILLRTRLSGGYLSGDNLFRGDLFRIGGLRSLRGFVENQFYASAYGIANIEFRAMISQMTYFMLFFDQSGLTDDLAEGMATQYPFGSGAGFSFSTQAGVFNFVFAMGKSNDQVFGLEQTKIHFGYISRF
jgi:outer membrane protein assembly factor BamA